MKLIKVNALVRCDMPMCNNKANYTITAKGVLRSRQINICKDCLNSLYEEISNEIIPKSPDNMIAKAVKKRRDQDAK